MEDSLTLEHVRKLHRRAAETGHASPWTLANGQVLSLVDIGDDPAVVWRRTMRHPLAPPQALRRASRRNHARSKVDYPMVDRLVERLRSHPLLMQMAMLRMSDGVPLKPVLDKWLRSFAEALAEAAGSSPRWALVLEALASGNSCSERLEDAIVERLVRFIRDSARHNPTYRHLEVAPSSAPVRRCA